MNTLEGNTLKRIDDFCIGLHYVPKVFILAHLLLTKSYLRYADAEYSMSALKESCWKISLLQTQKNKKALWSTGCSQIVVPDANTLVSRYLLQEYWRNLRDPFTAMMQNRDLHTEITGRSHRRQRASRWGGGGEGRGGRGELFRAGEFVGVVVFNRHVAAFIQAREAQIHKHPQKPSEELGECGGQGGWGGGGGWSATHPDHGG